MDCPAFAGRSLSADPSPFLLVRRPGRGTVPVRAARQCNYPGCPTLTHDGWCGVHRPASSGLRTHRSYAAQGRHRLPRKLREMTLSRANIPRLDWHKYAVDHRPKYDPAVEPDHMKYELVPMLLADHNRKTAARDGGFGRAVQSRA